MQKRAGMIRQVYWGRLKRVGQNQINFRCGTPAERCNRTSSASLQGQRERSISVYRRIQLPAPPLLTDALVKNLTFVRIISARRQLG